MNTDKDFCLDGQSEHRFETLDVQMRQMEDTMNSISTLTTPQSQEAMSLQETHQQQQEQKETADSTGLDLTMEPLQGQSGGVGTRTG